MNAQGRGVRIQLSTNRERRGASAWLVAIVLACLLGVLALAVRHGNDAPETVGLEPIAPHAHASTPRPNAIELPPRGADASSRAAGIGSATASKPTTHDFNGSGTIRGEVVITPGSTYPQTWTLVIEPHPFLEGRERAVRRRIEFTRGEREFAVTDLPLAGYVVRAQARGLNNVPADVLLVRGSAEQFVTTRLQPAGFIDGSVLTYAGAPAEALEITLESNATRERRTVLSDAAGNYRFDDVLDGAYTLTFGGLDAPLLPVDSISFKAPSLRFVQRHLPPTGNLKLITLDGSGKPRPDTHVFAEGEPRGSFDLRSDRFAEAHARHLWPGRYRIEAEVDNQRKADLGLRIEAGDELSLELRLRP